VAVNPRRSPVPAALQRAGEAKPLTHYTRADVAAAIDQFEVAAGGRKPLIAALTGIEPTHDLSYVLNVLADPEADARKLSDICKQSGIPLGELIQAFKHGVFAVPVVQAIRTIADRLPAVVDDVMRRGAPYIDTCTACRGTTTVTKRERRRLDDDGDEPTGPWQDLQVPCETCLATGTLEYKPSVDQQKLALSLTPLQPKTGPAVVVDNRSVNVNDTGPGGMGKILRGVDAILHARRGPVVEGVVADVSDGPTADDFDTE